MKIRVKEVVCFSAEVSKEETAAYSDSGEQ